MTVKTGRRRSERTRREPPPARSAYATLLSASDRVRTSFETVCAPFDITAQQYNVLRILRGAGKEGLACGEIAERMVNRDPDITRLLDRLEAQKLVRREREQKDRRVVTAYITAEGLKVLKELDRPMAELHERQLGHLEEQHLEHLSGLLQTAREKVS